MARTQTAGTKSLAGKNISVYLNKDLLALVESSGLPPSQLVQDALRQYFMDANRKQAAKQAADAAMALGSSPRFAEAVSAWQQEREKDRW